MRSVFVTLFSLVLFFVFGQEDFSEEEISFQNGDVMLRGTLLKPIQQELPPAIVFLHGSGPHSREGFRDYAIAFSKLGFASLFFDKRGTGSSSGSWISSSLNDLAHDAVAAVNYLKGREDIDTTRIGFWGISQAGWVAPVAASLTQDIAFMVIISGGGASPYESELFSYKKWFESQDFTENEKEQGVGLVNDYMDYLASGNQRDQLVDNLNAVTNKNLMQLANMLKHILPSEKGRLNWSWVGSYDPAEDLRRLNIPALVLMGALDTNQPMEIASSKWKEAYSDDPDLLSLVLFPEAGHGIRMGGGHNTEASFADGYWEVQIGWLWKNVISRRD